MGFARKDVEATKKCEKKFVRYQEGAEKYSLGLTKFQALAKEAKATYKIDKVVLVNCEIEYSCAMKSHFRKFGNQMSGSGNHLCKYTSLLA